jgi:plastocyanin
VSNVRSARRAWVPTVGLALLVPVVALVAVLLTRPHWDAATVAPRGADTITIRNFAFSPSPLKVVPGTRVTVTNADTTAHTLTSRSGAFDTGDLAGGARAVLVVPSKPGRYEIHCKIHNYMTGTLEVTG